MPIDNSRIPPEILAGPAKAMKLETGRDPDLWNDNEVARTRYACPEKYHGIPLENVRAGCIALRKAAKLGTNGSKNHGANKRLP